MRLIDLQPEWVGGAEGEREKMYLEFLCPKCPHPETDPLHTECMLMVPVEKGLGQHSPPRWGWNGEIDFEKVTLTPSIYHHCKGDAHFFITDGEIKFA